MRLDSCGRGCGLGTPSGGGGSGGAVDVEFVLCENCERLGTVGREMPREKFEGRERLDGLRGGREPNSSSPANI